VIAKAATHRLGAAFGGFVDPDFVDQNVLPVLAVSLSKARCLEATIEAGDRIVKHKLKPIRWIIRDELVQLSIGMMCLRR